MPIDHVFVLDLSAEGVPDDRVSIVKTQLIRELNDLGPIATPVSEGKQEGKRGDLVTLGQIGIALISAGLVQQVARVMIEFLRRNPKYAIQVGTLKVSKDHATPEDIEKINKEIERLLKQNKTKKKK